MTKFNFMHDSKHKFALNFWAVSAIVGGMWFLSSHQLAVAA
jgi:hypothetical protein